DYDPDGSERERRSSLGHVERVRRDASGRILDREFNQKRILHEYDANGRPTRTIANGHGRIDSEYEPTGHLRARSAFDAQGNLIAERRFTREVKGLLQSIFDTHRGDAGLEHDPAGRLTAFVPKGGPAEHYRFDKNNNLFVD